MFKKTPHKRKLKNILRQLIILAIIFAITLSSLILLSLFLKLKKNRYLSPLALSGIKIFNASTNNDALNKIQSMLGKYGISYTTLTSSVGNSTLVTLNDQQQIIFSNSKSLEQQFSSLQLIIRQLTIEGKRFNRIDFRFDNPVVSFN